jgi:hypothetical protein
MCRTRDAPRARDPHRLDSTTATKAIAWRPHGSLAGEGRSPVPLSSPPLDKSRIARVESDLIERRQHVHVD